jgi:pimeloyl-ACP methyl ester carboxylesterase
LLRALGLDSADVLGWSLGSAVAQQLAIDHPEQVTSLTLLNTWAKTDVYQAAMFSALGHPWRTGDREVALTALGLAFTPAFLNSESFPAVMGQAEPLFPRTPVAMRTVAQQWDADLHHDTIDHLARINIPVLVATADQDLLTPPMMGHQVAQLIPDSELHEFTGLGAGHAVVLERPDDVAATVVGFLKRVRDNVHPS